MTITQPRSGQSSPAQSSLQTTGPCQLAPHTWSMRHANAARTGQSTRNGAKLGTVRWSQMIAGEPNSFAVDCVGRAHIGVVYHNRYWSSTTYAYTLTPMGEIAWRAKVTPYPWGFAQNVTSSPALDGSGNVIVPSSNGELLRFTPAGQLDWTYAGSSNAGNDSSPVVRDDGSVVHFQTGHGLASLTPGGQVQWLKHPSLSSNSLPALSPDGSLAMGGIKSTQPHGWPALYYFFPNGDLRWQVDTTFGSRANPIFGPDGTVYHCTIGIRAYSPNGTVLWSHSFGKNTPALSNAGRLYVAEGSTVFVLNAASGTQLSSITAPGTVLDGMALGPDGTLYLTTTSGHLCAYDSIGSPIFEVSACASFVTGPVIGADETCVAGGQINGSDYCVISVQ